MLSAAEARERWRGVVIPLVTPLTEEGHPDLEALERNVRWLLEKGARQGNSIFLAAGSGGDFPMLNVRERKAVIQCIAAALNGEAPLIAAVQSLDWRETVELCEACATSGVDAVQISAPFYYDGRPGDAEAWLGRIAEQTSVRFAIYNNWYTGYDMPLDLIERLLEIPNTIGVKWSSPSIELFTEGVHRFGERVAVINNTLVSVFGHMIGCRGFVSHWPNFYPEFCWTLWDLMEARRYADAQSYFEGVMRPYRAVVADIAAQTAGEGVFVRPFMRLVGLEAGCSPLPSRDQVITDDVIQRMDRVLANARELTKQVSVDHAVATSAV